MSIQEDSTFAIENDSPSVQRRLDELGVDLDPDIDYHLETVFPKTEGWGWKGNFKKKLKLVKYIEAELADILREGEQVQYVAKGTQYSFWEAYFMGIWAYTINRTVFVLTNVRLIMIRTDGKGKPKKTFWMIYHSEIEKFKVRWNGMIQMKMRDRTKRQFSGFPKQDRKTMRAVFESTLAKHRELGFSPEVSQSLENMCGNCKAIVAKDDLTCDHCGQKFWKPSELAWRSLLFPSWGDFLMGHHTVAVAELFGGLLSWFVIVGLVIAGVNNDRLAENLVVAFVIFLLAHGIDACITYSVATKGLHPKAN